MLISTVFSNMSVLAADSGGYAGYQIQVSTTYAGTADMLFVTETSNIANIHQMSDSSAQMEAGTVAYCFDTGKNYPATICSDGTSAGTAAYSQVIASKAILDANNSKTGRGNLKDEMVKLYYYGYPTNAAGIGNGLSDAEFYVATQRAVWYYLKNTLLVDAWSLTDGLSGAALAAYYKLADADGELPYPDADNYSLMFYTTNTGYSGYQPLISMQLVDKDGNPADAEDIAPGGTSKETTAQTTEATEPETQATEKQTDATVDNEVITMVDKATVTTDSETPVTSSTEAPKPEEPDNDVIVMVDKATVTTDSETPATSSTEAPKPEETEAPDNDVIIMVDKETTVTPDPGTPVTPSTETPSTDKPKETEAPDNDVIIMVDEKTENPETVTVDLSKQDAAGVELPGASVEVKDANETVIDSWTSGTTPHTIEVEPGSYWFIETAAPEGYKIATSINFIVGEDKSITVGGVKLESDAPVVMVDDVADTPATEPTEKQTESEKVTEKQTESEKVTEKQTE
jgi:TQXA domain-containing protein